MADVNDTNANVDDNSTQNQATQGNDTKQNTNTNTDPKADEKKYSDKEMNDISKKNSDKAVSKFMKELGITDVEKAKAILKTAAEEEEKNKSVDEKTQEALKKAEKATLAAMNTKIENALLRKKVDDGKVTRASRLVNKENIIDENGEIDENKLNSEIEAIIKDFPELIPATDDNSNVGFKVGGDGKQDKKDQSQEIARAFGLKNKK